jgi:TRAP-type C4-dicarboxylate transport system permease small subunit
MISSVILQVYFRYIKGSALSWTLEISSLSFMWFTFSGSALISLKKSHIEVDYFFNKLTNKKQYIIEKSIDTLIIFLGIIVLYSAYKAIVAAQGVRSVVLRIPMIYFYLSIFFGFIGIIIFNIIHLLHKKY